MWIKKGRFLFRYKIHAGRNLPLILELSIHNPDISTTVLKEKKDNKKLKTFFKDYYQNNYQQIKF